MREDGEEGMLGVGESREDGEEGMLGVGESREDMRKRKMNKKV